MSIQIISIIGLVVIFLLATLRSVNMGAVAFLGVFLIGSLVLHESDDDLFAGFPGDLFVVLVGVTLLFAIAKENGTVDWLINVGVRAVRGRIALIPWVMFLITSLLTMVGAVVPGAIAIMAPIGLKFAARYRIDPLLMGVLIINGGSAGGFSPISIFGSITNGVVARSGLPGSPAMLWMSTFAFNVVLSLVVFFLFGGKQLIGRRVTVEESPQESSEVDVSPAGGSPDTLVAGPRASSVPPEGALMSPTTATPSAERVATADAGASPLTAVTTLNLRRAVTLIGLASLVVGALLLEFDVGLLSLSIATIICLFSPQDTKACFGHIAWSTVLLICGVVTYVSLMERVGTIDFLGNSVAGIGVPLLAAFVICLIGGAVSAFASTTGILGALIPLAVPFLLTGQVGAVGLIIALAISSSVVDSSPFSTSGALVVANSAAEIRDSVFRRLMIWGMSMILIAPVAASVIFVVPGWL